MRLRKAMPLVRLHHEKMAASLEGFLVGRWHGHYVLRVAKLVESEESTFSFDGPEVRVPVEHVLFVEVLAPRPSAPAA